MRRYRWVRAVCYLIVVDVAMTQSAPRLGVNTIAEVVAAMTPDEKVGLPCTANVSTRLLGASSMSMAMVFADGLAGVRIAPSRRLSTTFPVHGLLKP